MKKILKLTAALFAAACLMVTAVSAQSAVLTKGTVSTTSGSLRVRSSGSTSASVSGYLSKGTSVTILSSYSGWYEIQYGSLTGWASASYIKSLSTSGISAAKASTAVNAAEAVIGTRYLYGGNTASGFDCSGFVQYAYAKAGVTLPHSSSSLAQKGTAVSSSSLKPGDLVFFATGSSGTINHVGLYLGNHLFIAANSGGVAVCDLRGSYWSGAYVSARRIVS